VAAQAGVQTPESDGTWYDLGEGRTETSDLETLDESGAWRGLQWLNAFEILVCLSSHACPLHHAYMCLVSSSLLISSPLQNAYMCLV
jgi:hypothetical protein